MIPYFADERAVLIRGEALDALRAMPDDSVDSWVTDPPAGISFMGKGWDSDKGGRDAWIAWLAEIAREALRVLKPGAHGLVWALPRTSHWTATALENAGFEIRDVHLHLFGTGFPKSLDVSKAIDKDAGHWRGRAGAVTIESQPSKGTEYERSEKGDPVTAAAAKWQGWGTALKPAAEHWILVRKPLAGTVAANVLEHGTGALNIDACRIGYDASGPPAPVWGGRKGEKHGTKYGHSDDYESKVSAIGRWPAHVSLAHLPECDASIDSTDDAYSCVPGCPVRMLDEQSGTLKSGNLNAGHKRGSGVTSYDGGGGIIARDYGGDTGGASRFFYVAKGSRSEKDLGCEHLPPKSGSEITGREEGSAGSQHARAGAGARSGARNHHPTVKSIALMRWLCRLITPPGGLVLDCFAGSGSTGVAAIAEGFSFVGVERDLDDETGEPLGYCEIIKARLIRALADYAKKEAP